jgi:hypothetical protein
VPRAFRAALRSEIPEGSRTRDLAHVVGIVATTKTRSLRADNEIGRLLSTKTQARL